MNLSENQFYDLCACNACDPVPLVRGMNFPNSFVYDREHGIFEVGPGSHHVLMRTLWGWRSRGNDIFELGVDAEAYAERFLQQHGTGFLSSVGRALTVWTPLHLDEFETDCFRQHIGFDFCGPRRTEDRKRRLRTIGG